MLIQTENNGSNKTHILAAKVRYGGERFVVGLVINENNGKFFYDHELTEINALIGSASEETDAEPNKASVKFENLFCQAGLIQKVQNFSVSAWGSRTRRRGSSFP